MSHFGYYSALAMDAFRNGKIVLKPCLWRSPTGEEVVITSVGSTPIPADSGYCWSDARCVGEVVEYSRELPAEQGNHAYVLVHRRTGGR